MAMAQATLSPALFLDQGHCPQQSGRVRRSVIRMSAVPSSRYRISGFGGTRGASLGGTATFGQDFRSRATSSVNSRRRRTSRFVCRAMFARCTEKGIKAIICAHEEARLLGHNFVGTEQILLGLIGEGTSIAAKVLESMGINIKDARVEVEKIIGRGGGVVAAEIPITPRAKRVMDLALEEARQLGHKCVGAEHILLGLLREGEVVGARILENLGADPSNIRTEVIRMVGEGNEDGDVPGGLKGQFSI